MPIKITQGGERMESIDFRLLGKNGNCKPLSFSKNHCILANIFEDYFFIKETRGSYFYGLKSSIDDG